jgi:hypothetical protein
MIAAKVKLDKIRLDGGTQMRKNLNMQMIYSYKEAMENGDIFPKLHTVFDGKTHWLVDGFHRYHAYKLLNEKEVDVHYEMGNQLEAQVIAFGVNGKHGKQRTNAEKHDIVSAALIHELTKDKSDREIARICQVSAPFVASVRNPEVKERQAKQIEKHFEKKIAENNNPSNDRGVIKLHPGSDSFEPVSEIFAPDDDELRANELAEKADRELLNKLLDASEPLAVAYEEIKKLTLLNAQQETRIAALQREKNEAIADAKRAQAQLDKLRKEKK